MALAETGMEKVQSPSRLRYAVVIGSSLLIMLCAGSVYAWSIFVAPLKTFYGLTTAQTQLVYGCNLAILAIGLVIMHAVFKRLGPRLTAAIGAVLFGLGYLTASFSGGNFWAIFIGISLLSGLGMSMGYITVLTNLVMWLPRNRGLATGIAVAGFGGGSVLMPLLASPLIKNGVDILVLFRALGIGYGLLFLLGALLLSALLVPINAVLINPVRSATVNCSRTGVSGSCFIPLSPLQ
jgi:OFA family oxalate/formate antiporter-like MFS transporter